MSNVQLPLGFGMALAQNETAMHRFESMAAAEKQSVIQRAYHISSKQEMQQLVDDIAGGRHPSP